MNRRIRHISSRPVQAAGAAAASLLAFWLPAVATAATADAGDECAKLPKPTVSVKRIEAPVALELQYGYRTLGHLGAALARPGNRILGLTRGHAVANIQTRAPGFVDASGRWECLSPQLTLSLGYSPMTVYVAREFPAGGCAYKEIHEHEQRHVKAYLDHLAVAEKEIAATLSARFVADGPWRGPVGELRERLQREIAERWLPYAQRELRRAEEAQALIDSPEEYARVADACGGEIRKRVM